MIQNNLRGGKRSEHPNYSLHPFRVHFFAHFQPQTPTFKPCFGAFMVTLWQPLSFLNETGFLGAVWNRIHARHDAGIPTPPSTPQLVVCGLRTAGGTKWMTHAGAAYTALPQTRSKTVKLLLQHPVETSFCCCQHARGECWWPSSCTWASCWAMFPYTKSQHPDL